MKFELEWKGERYLLEWFENVDFEKLKDVVQSYGFIFDKKGRVCIVDCDKGYWTLPGGTVEDSDESYEETLRREVDEEADLDIKNIREVGGFKVTPLSENCERGVHYILRYVAEVDKMKKQTVDPCNGKISKRKFVSVGEFGDYVKWGKDGEFQLGKALEVLGE
jgi:8-oxo-dGTP pyrophosphatase MutT (NUDIX family)